MTDDTKKPPPDDKPQGMQVIFAPGCFDSFDGTPEELAEIMAEIQTKFANMKPGEIPEGATPLTDEDREQLAEMLAEQRKNNPRQ